MSENPCKDKFDEMLEALEKWENAQRKSRILPIADTPLDVSKEIEPVVITKKKLGELREFKALEDTAYEEYLQSIDDYMACLRKHGWID